jgi:hypothetical protein
VNLNLGVHDNNGDVAKISGEKPFRCLLKTCLKRFRYKGDLSKHIKRYHPGHSQQLTPVPLQEDEIANMASTVVVTTSLSNNIDNNYEPKTVNQNQPRIMLATSGGSVRTQNCLSLSNNTSLIQVGNGSHQTFTAEDRKLLFVPLLPQHPVQQAELLASGFSNFGPSDLGMDCMDPSLDENFLDLLTKDEDGGILELSPLPPPPPPPPPPLQNAPAASKLHEALTRVNRPPDNKKSTAIASFVVPSSTGLVRPRLPAWNDSSKTDCIKIEPSKVLSNIKIEPGTAKSLSSTSKWTDSIKLEPITSGTR